MQEIHSIGGGGTSFFGGGGGDRRLRPHLNNNNNNPNNQALNCPRCDSINTKFCYYNNYNLSQPRHFCKNCRRYWTKGGVLRNVPVGGGCRKSKRSTKPKNSSSSSAEIADLPTSPPEPENKSNSHSSSESSSLTAAAITDSVSEPTQPNSNPKINTALENDSLEQQGTGDCGIFSEIATFTSLITSSNDTLPFGFSNGNGNSNCNVNGFTDPSSFNWQHQKMMTVTGDQPHQHEDALKLLPENLGAGGSSGSLMDHGIDFSVLQSKTSNGGFGSLDWHGADQGLFDLPIPNTVDHGYWNHTQWSDHDQDQHQDQDQDHSSLFHLP